MKTLTICHQIGGLHTASGPSLILPRKWERLRLPREQIFSANIQSSLTAAGGETTCAQHVCLSRRSAFTAMVAYSYCEEHIHPPNKWDRGTLLMNQ